MFLHSLATLWVPYFIFCLPVVVLAWCFSQLFNLYCLLPVHSFYGSDLFTKLFGKFFEEKIFFIFIFCVSNLVFKAPSVSCTKGSWKKDRNGQRGVKRPVPVFFFRSGFLYLPSVPTLPQSRKNHSFLWVNLILGS